MGRSLVRSLSTLVRFRGREGRIEDNCIISELGCFADLIRCAVCYLGVCVQR